MQPDGHTRFYTTLTDATCAGCHNAVNISSRLSKDQKHYVPYLKLLDEVGEGRRKGQRRIRFERDYKKLQRLESYWSKRAPIKMPAVWDRQIHEHFYFPDDVPEIGASKTRD